MFGKVTNTLYQVHVAILVGLFIGGFLLGRLFPIRSTEEIISIEQARHAIEMEEARAIKEMIPMFCGAQGCRN